MSNSRISSGRPQAQSPAERSPPTEPSVEPTDRSVAERARRAAIQVCKGYRAHDDRARSAAVDAFAFVDDAQFQHLDGGEARAAATALVDALWAKDAVEGSFVSDGVVERPAALSAAGWDDVESPLRRRARIVGMDEAYGRLTTESWKRHKVGGEYSLPALEAQRIEVAAAVGTESYPTKDRAGRSGFGELPARYLVAIELHDDRDNRSSDRAVDVMTPYFETILAAHEDADV